MAVFIGDTGTRREMVLLLPPYVISTLKTESRALNRYVMGDTFRNSHRLGYP